VNWMKHGSARRRPAFTLMELVLSMAVMTILMGGVSAAMLLASKAVPDRKTALSAVNESYHAIARVQSELANAKRIKNPSAIQISFTVADRNNDGVDETIMYIWSGVAGTPLKRKYNAEALTDVVEDVREFQLTYDKKLVPQKTTPGPNESNESLLLSYDPAGTPTNLSITSNDWIGQYFKPTLPVDATAWKIARVELRTPTGSYLPSGAVVDDANMMESLLGDTHLWQEFSFSAATGLSPSQGLCLVVRWISDTTPCDVQRGPAGSATVDYNVVSTTSAGASWSSGTEALPFQVFGTVTTPSTPAAVNLEQVSGVRIRLRVGNDANAGLDAGVQILNQPEL